MKWLFTILLLSFFFISFTQQRIDSQFAFQSDPAKKYSIYIPSSYNSAVPNKLMVGLHPWNVARWNAKVWCDTLITFAEDNGLLLVCPDGGIDGQVDDKIDTAFTSTLLDSVKHWYNIKEYYIYLMGFSWGGKTTYTYGLNNSNKFNGFMPIGAAISLNEVLNIKQNAKNEIFYIIHGDQDVPGTRFTPLKSAMESEGGIVNSKLLAGVGHSIDFADKNQIISSAFQWIDSVNSSMIENQSNILTTISENDISIYPNPSQNGIIKLHGKFILNSNYEIFESTGKLVLSGILNSSSLDLRQLKKGNYYLTIIEENEKLIYRILLD